MTNKKKKGRQELKQELKETMAHLTVLCDSYYIYDNPMLDELLHWSNDCYNELTYLVRRHYFNNIRAFKHELHMSKARHIKQTPKFGKSLTATELARAIKEQSQEGQNTLYFDCINTKIINSIVRNVQHAWTSYFKAKSDFKTHPYKYLSAPKLPSYLAKGKRHSTELDTQTIKVKDDYIVYDKLGLKVKMSPYLKEAVYGKSNDLWLNKLEPRRRIRSFWLKPITNGVKLCVSYIVSNEPLTTYKGLPVPKRQKGIIVSGDPGVDNLLALVTNNTDFAPLIINGKGIKSVNHYYNKRKALLQVKTTQCKQKGITVHKKDGTIQTIYHTGKRYSRLTEWRNNKILDAIHKATDRVLEYAISCGAEKIIIGRNKYWKQKTKMGKQTNQNFVGIPHRQVIMLLEYKAKRYGIDVISQPEAYTSQTSFFDYEESIWKNGNKSRKRQGKSPINRRIHRGLFKSNQGILINADINGALQIAHKYDNNFNLQVFRNSNGKKATEKRVIGLVSHPDKWSPVF
ncbi:transposase [uncultured Lactobacillus sp.]|uniref:RNA-guided endonuclease InsQ/TnpB family protein n=1 Tax=uncultured Lactobacillus sp. TaxID=153152 RepID=UPI0028055643|nr:transposase [uncultured Lactobacillus sp.]